MQFLFPKSYEVDSGLMVSQFGLKKFNYQLIFDDQLYEDLVPGMESYFMIQTDTGLFQTKLKDFDLLAVRDHLKRDEPKEPVWDKQCVMKINSDDHFELTSDGTIISTSRVLNRVTYYGKGQSESFSVIPDSGWVRMAYEAYFGPLEYERHFKKYLELAYESPQIMQSKVSFVHQENNELWLYTDIKFWEYIDSIQDRVRAYSRMALYSFDLNSKTIKSLSMIPSMQAESAYHLDATGRFFYDADTFYFFVSDIHPKDTTKILAKYLKTDEGFQFVRLMDFEMPSNYIKYHLGNNLKNFCGDDHVFSFAMSDVIYDRRTRRTIQIPVDTAEFQTLEGFLEYAWFSVQSGTPLTRPVYYLYDVADKGTHYGVVYRDRNEELYELVFDKETGAVLNKINLPLDFKKLDGLKYHPRYKNVIVFYDLESDERCIEFFILNQ